MKTIIILSFILFGVVANAQLVDPFGKVIAHEIKLTKLDDGGYTGAMEWTTGGVDSLQRFIVKGLSVKAPVMVRIISKAPKHNIDVSFHKSNWDKIESKVSTGEDKFVDKIFRTMNMAGIGVSSKVAGIPYVIIIKVGLQFPSTNPLIRITDDIEEYNTHLKKLGIVGITTNTTGTTGNTNTILPLNDDGNNTMMYIIIGLLTAIIILLALFLLRKKKSKSILSLFVALMCLGSVMAQSEPKLVPVDGQGESPVFQEYATSNVSNQTPVTTETVAGKALITTFKDDGTTETRAVEINVNSGVTELTGEEAAEVMQRIKEANEAFDEEYNEDMPGEPTEGSSRIPPADQTQEELEQLRRQVQRLQRQVDLLSREDEKFEKQNNEGGKETLIFCEQCHACLNGKVLEFAMYQEYLQYLQNFYSSEITSINDQIAHVNSVASIPGTGIGWGNILMYVIRPAVDELNQAYSDQFDYYIGVMETKISEIIACTGASANPDQINQTAILQAQLFDTLNSLKALKINI